MTILLGLMVLVSGWVMAAWAQSTATPARPAGITEIGQLNVAIASFSTLTLDPLKSRNVLKGYQNVVYDFLIGADDKGSLVDYRGLAVKWERLADGKGWTIILRKGARWHNGDPITADDLKFHLERLISKETQTSYVGSFRAMLAGPASIEILDPQTVRVRTKAVDIFLPHMMSTLGGTEGFVTPKKYYEGLGGTTQERDVAFNLKPVGSGPYRVVEAVPGSHLLGEAFRDYWRGIPRFNRVRLREVPEGSTRAAMLRTGEVHIIETDREAAGSLKKAGFTIFRRVGDVNLGYLIKEQWVDQEYGKRTAPSVAKELGKPLPEILRGLPNGGINPLSVLKVRQALNYAIDRKAILDTLFGGQGKASCQMILSSASLGYRSCEPWPYDPVKARRLLAEAGYPNGFPVTILEIPLGEVPEVKAMNEAVSGYWKAAGIRVTILRGEYAPWRAMMIDHTLTQRLGPAVLAVSSFAPLPHVLVEVLRHSNSRFVENRPYPELDKMIEEAIKASDMETYLRRMADIQGFTRDNALDVPLIETGAVFAADPRIGVNDWKMDVGLSSYSLDSLFGFR